MVSVHSAGAAAVCCVSALDGVSIRAGWAGPALAPCGSCTVCPASLPVCPLCLGLAVGAPSFSCFGRRGGSLSCLEHWGVSVLEIHVSVVWSSEIPQVAGVVGVAVDFWVFLVHEALGE